MFMVRFSTMDKKQKAIDVGPIMYDSKPIIVKNWTPDFDLKVENICLVPTWIKLPSLPLKFWGQSTLNKPTATIGK